MAGTSKKGYEREVGLNREMAGNRAEWRRRCQTTVDPGVPG